MSIYFLIIIFFQFVVKFSNFYMAKLGHHTGALQAKKRNFEEKKSKDKILISSPVSIFFDKSFLVSSQNKILSKSNLRELGNALK